MSYGYQPIQRPTINFGWINESWEIVKRSWGVWAGVITVYTLIVGIIVFGLFFGFGIFSSMMTQIQNAATTGAKPDPLAIDTAIYGNPLYWVVNLVSWALSAFFLSGMMQMANRQVRGEAINLAMMFQGGPRFLPFLAMQFVVMLLGILGTYICIFPGLVVYAMFLPALACVADGDSFGEAFNKSTSAMKENWLNGAMFVLVMFLVYMFGTVLTCGIGFFVTFPMGLICISLVYRDLIGMPGYSQPQAQQAFAPQAGAWPPPPTQPYNPYANQPQQPYNPYAGQQGQPQNPYSNQPPPQPNNPYANQPPQPPVQPVDNVATPYMPYLNPSTEVPSDENKVDDPPTNPQ